MARGVIIGVVGTLLVGLLAVYLGVTRGLMPANADGPPLRLERWAARTSLRATLKAEASKQPNPLPASDANLLSGIKLYEQNCAVCHGVANAEPSNVAKGLYQRPPQLAKDGVEDDPAGVTYWKIDHGIRFTGMPAFGKTLSERQLWQLTLVLEHMDRLPSAPERAWKALKNPSG